jgi:pimeloyl-ACP methyl ester carboxylesterase
MGSESKQNADPNRAHRDRNPISVAIRLELSYQQVESVSRIQWARYIASPTQREKMLWYIFACGSNSSDTAVESETLEVVAPLGSSAPVGSCARAHSPFVMVHGFLASGDTYSNHAARFAANGFCQDRFLSLDWDTLDQGSNEAAITALDILVDEALEATGSTQVVLMGHSAGGGLGISYLEDLERASKISHYIHIGSFEALPPSVPMLNLYSSADMTAGGSDIEGVENIDLIEDDHFQVATSDASFESIYGFLYESPPGQPGFPSADQPLLWGKALLFGSNEPMEGASVEAYPLDSETGQRLRETPETLLSVGPEGLWGPLRVDSVRPYELRLVPDDGLVIRHYFAPFGFDDYLVRLRGMPEEGMAAQLLSSIPMNEESVNLVTFSKSQAVIAGRDSLSLDGVEIATEDRTPAEDTIIALFHYDAEEDGASGSDPALFGAFPFLGATDTHWGSDPQKSIEIQFNGTRIAIPRKGEGVALSAL